MKTYLTIVCAFLVGYSLTTKAEVYRHVDKDGNVVYTDRPETGAEKVDIAKPASPDSKPQPIPVKPVTTATPKTTLVSTKQPSSTDFSGYTKFSLVKPQNEETMLDNEGNIAIQVAIEPELVQDLGHQVAVYLDGTLVKKFSRATGISLTNIDRGSHQLQVAVLDKSGKQLNTSSTITVFLRRQSILFGK